MYESGSGFIVHFFSRDTAKHLRRDLTFWAFAKFAEGTLPRKLFRVTLRKKEA
jgi:hypothetical protein